MESGEFSCSREEIAFRLRDYDDAIIDEEEAESDNLDT